MVSRFLRRQWFPLSILVAVTAGITFPGLQVLSFGGLTNTGIVVVLFLGIGFTLPSESIGKGVRNWPLHLGIQSMIFVVYPAVMWAVGSVLPFSPQVLTGLYALAVLPTTVSSCVVFCQARGGNVAGIMFNAALSNSLGVFLSPLLLSLLLRTGVGGLGGEEMRAVFISLTWKMLAPIAVGQLLRLVSRQRAMSWKKTIGKTSNILIVVIVLLAVSKSAPTLKASASEMIMPFLFLVVLQALMLLALRPLGDVLKLPPEDRIALFFAAPQKTLALGVPLLTSYFLSRPDLLGVALLPILFYHPLQLLVAGLVSSGPLFRFWRTEA